MGVVKSIVFAGAIGAAAIAADYNWNLVSKAGSVTNELASSVSGATSVGPRLNVPTKTIGGLEVRCKDSNILYDNKGKPVLKFEIGASGQYNVSPITGYEVVGSDCVPK
ncbi:hypothetical protein HYU09_04315 [Candidatus Woesearchaeota archaeon]|nr:hypothetical protein [Candidatus Woesearchaeota archaeon]